MQQDAGHEAGQEAGGFTRLRSNSLAGAPFWLILLVLWGLMELAWRWRRVRARIS